MLAWVACSIATRNLWHSPRVLSCVRYFVVSDRCVEGEASKLDLENMNLLLRNMPPKVDAEEVRLAPRYTYLFCVSRFAD